MDGSHRPFAVQTLENQNLLTSLDFLRILNFNAF